MIGALKEAGLTDNESKVYRALLQLGPSLAGAISRKTGLHRRTVYDTTEMLIQKGLLGYILKNNRRLFHASSPERVLEMIDEKKRSIEGALPSMMDLFVQTNQSKDETRFFKGREGIKSVFEDQLNYSEVLILGASVKAYEFLEFYFHWYDKKRVAKKVHTKILASDKKITNIPLSEIRYLPQKYTSPVSINVYGDKVAIILWAKELVAVVISEENIASAYRNYFDLLWKAAKKA